MASSFGQTPHRPFGAHLEDHIAPKVDESEVFICALPAVPEPDFALPGRTHDPFFRTLSFNFRTLSLSRLGLAKSSSVTSLTKVKRS